MDERGIDTNKIDDLGRKIIENMVLHIVEELEGRDFYSRFLDQVEELKVEGLNIEEYTEPSSFLIENDKVEEMIDEFTSCFLQRFYFSKEDCGEV